MTPRSLIAAATVGLALLAPTAAQAAPPQPTFGQATLTGRSVLPAVTYQPGSETSGHWAWSNPPVTNPFPAQPVQGFSGTHRLPDGTYYVMEDNGYGSKANSADFLLAVQHIAPNTATGTTQYLGLVFNLSDPDHLIPWPIWRDGGCAAAASLPSGYTCPGRDRLLTGWDFDIESMQIAKDGTFWFGDEFGPYLLHTDAQGRLLEAPIPTPGVKSKSNPTLAAGEQWNLRDSKGFEGMAIAPNGQRLYPLLEGAVNGDALTDLRLYTVDINGTRGARFRDDFLYYRMESPTNAIGDFIMINAHQGLVIERDNGAGATAQFKRVYLIDLRDTDHDGYVTKTLVADLMDIANPKNIGGFGPTFTFPFVTIEDVEIIDERTIAIMNDNNFPGGGGRSGAPDNNEYLELRLTSPLKVDHRLLAR